VKDIVLNTLIQGMDRNVDPLGGEEGCSMPSFAAPTWSRPRESPAHPLSPTRRARTLKPTASRPRCRRPRRPRSRPKPDTEPAPSPASLSLCDPPRASADADQTEPPGTEVKQDTEPEAGARAATRFRTPPPADPDQAHPPGASRAPLPSESTTALNQKALWGRFNQSLLSHARGGRGRPTRPGAPDPAGAEQRGRPQRPGLRKTAG
jgi:hypothetical protein